MSNKHAKIIFAHYTCFAYCLGYTYQTDNLLHICHKLHSTQYTRTKMEYGIIHIYTAIERKLPT